MYNPAHFEETRLDVLHTLVRSHPLATLVVMSADGLLANHIPLYLRQEGTLGTLVGHIARANPLWTQMEASVEALAIFQGPQHYISPGWYATKQEHGKVVPTWNYAVVHGKGPLSFHHEADWIRQLLLDLTTQQESVMPSPWSVDDAPRDYTDALLRALVGIEIPLASLLGKWKVSQNQPAVNQCSVVTALQTQNESDAQAMAQLITERGVR
jgi:transcriptional regulator